MDTEKVEVKCHDLHSFGIALTRNEKMPDKRTGNLGSNGLCAVMDTHQKPRNLVTLFYTVG